MNIAQIKDEFHTNYKPKIQSFFAPLQPLRKAILAFCYTTLWMVVVVIIIVMLLFKIIGWYYHHKYMSKYNDRWYYYSRDMWPKWGFDDRRVNDDMRMMYDYEKDDIFDRTERYLDTQRRMMQDRINHIINSKSTTVIKLDSDGTGVQQSISRISSINGENQWYTLTVINHTINWSVIWPISNKIKEWLQKNNITLDNNNFSTPYNPELWNSLTTLFENK